MKNDINFWINHFLSMHKSCMNTGRQILIKFENNLATAEDSGPLSKQYYREMIEEQKDYIAAHKFMIDAINDLRTKKKLSKV